MKPSVVAFHLFKRSEFSDKALKIILHRTGKISFCYVAPINVFLLEVQDVIVLKKHTSKRWMPDKKEFSRINAISV